jgi:Tol biopolymer transport system component
MRLRAGFVIIRPVIKIAQKAGKWAWIVFVVFALSGCAEPEFNPTPTHAESDVLGPVQQLTTDFDRAGQAYFSHDMNWIIFQAVPHGQKQLQLFVAPFQHNGVAVNIGQAVRITPASARSNDGYFSPDGNSLIFASTALHVATPAPGATHVQPAGRDFHWSTPAGMEIYRADGWPAALAAVGPGGSMDLAQHPLTDNEYYNAECSYSPDGKWIAFTSNRTGDLDVYVMHADGSHIVQITKTPGYDGDAFFSPDGKRLVYRSDRNQDGLLQIFVGTLAFDSSGEITGLSGEQQLTHNQSVNWQPTWHPDDQHIVYATSYLSPAGATPTNYELFLMRADGSHKTRLTFFPDFDGQPVFSPDGNYLMWTSKRTATHAPQIFIARFHMPPGT